MTAGVVAVLGLLLVSLALDHRRSLRCLRARKAALPAPPTRYPSVTVVRPVKGTDAEQEENFRAALETGYPGPHETIFVLEDEDDPAWARARRAIDARGDAANGEARILLSGRPPAGRTGKIHNMVAGEAEADGEIIVFGDSDTRPDAELLSNLVAHLMARDSIGAAFAPVVNPCRPRSAGDVASAIILNAYYVAGMEVALGEGRTLPFLMGQTMAFRRTALEEIGGAACATGQLVDDMYLGARIVDAGHENVVGTHPLEVIHYGLRFGEFMRLWRRWLFCGRGGIPGSFARPFVVRAVSYFLSLGLAIAMLALGHPGLAGFAAVVWILEGLHYVRLHRAAGGAPIPLRLLWAAWLPYLMTIPIGLSMLLRPQLEWRGHTYRLDHAARLRPSRGAGHRAKAGSPPPGP